MSQDEHGTQNITKLKSLEDRKKFQPVHVEQSKTQTESEEQLNSGPRSIFSPLDCGNVKSAGICRQQGMLLYINILLSRDFAVKRLIILKPLESKVSISKSLDSPRPAVKL